MRRQKSLKRAIKIPYFIERLREAFFKKILAVALIAIVSLSLAVLLAKAFLRTSHYFRLKNIEVLGPLTPAISESLKNEFLTFYKNKNVFEISLKGIERALREAYPDAKDISVKIALPDKIAIALKFRKAVALVSEARSYLVDDDGVVISNIDPLLLKGLPVIRGLGIRYGWKAGQKSESKNLKYALELMREIKKSHLAPSYRLTAVDATDIKTLSFSLNDSFEVRIGCENLKDRLNLLKKTLKSPRLVIERIKYIDVRFEEAVIGPK